MKEDWQFTRKNTSGEGGADEDPPPRHVFFAHLEPKICVFGRSAGQGVSREGVGGGQTLPSTGSNTPDRWSADFLEKKGGKNH